MLQRFATFCIFILIMFFGNVYAESSTTLDAPKNVTVSLKHNEVGEAHFQFNYEASETIRSLLKRLNPDAEDLLISVHYKVNGSDWSNCGYYVARKGFAFIVDPLYQGFYEKVDTSVNTYYFKLKFAYSGLYADSYSESPFSNICSIGVNAIENQYSNASSWAISELNSAMEYGLITDKILNQNMNAPITREEFCELVVKFYERIMYTTVSFNDKTAFNDTQNPEVFKAYELGIVDGVGMKKYDPNSLTNREQIATMMYRAVKVIRPNADYSINSILNYSDSGLVSSWALESVKFMNKNGIMKGDVGKIDPKVTTSREQAVIIIKRVFENYAGLPAQLGKAVYPKQIESMLPDFFPRERILIFDDAEDFEVEMSEDSGIAFRYKSYKSAQKAYDYFRDLYIKGIIDENELDGTYSIHARTPEYSIILDTSNSSARGMINVRMIILPLE